MHAIEEKNVASRSASSIRIGSPIYPFVVRHHTDINQDVREKLELAKRTLHLGGFTMLQNAEWPMGKKDDIFSEALDESGPLLGTMTRTALSQMAQFVHEYLDAPVSTKEIIEHIGKAGANHNPAGGFKNAAKNGFDETKLRQLMGPHIPKLVETYNSYFDLHNVDLILIPSARAATPDLDLLSNGKVVLTSTGGGSAKGGDSSVFGGINFVVKHLHIPKMCIPTGLTEDGRPTAVQLWGRAMEYDQMYDDNLSQMNDVKFLHLVNRVSQVLAANPKLKRKNASHFFNHLVNYNNGDSNL